jgi:hypothetical protein
MTTDVLDTLRYRDYCIEIVAFTEAENPLTEDELVHPTLCLHSQAEKRFGWTTDSGWATRLDDALDQIAQRGVTRHLYGAGGALEVVSRWLKVFHGIPVVLHVSAIDHSGVAVYLGAGEHPSDPGGWDSGWIGWLFATPEQLEAWGTKGAENIEQSLRASFDEFAAWVSGDVFGYRIINPDDVALDECFGFYGSDCIREPDGWVLKDCHGFIDNDIAAKEGLG